jgi:hypothetical protein
MDEKYPQKPAIATLKIIDTIFDLVTGWESIQKEKAIVIKIIPNVEGKNAVKS